jgi:Holliday junction resolvasome RuvABC endonuclease subunit
MRILVFDQSTRCSGYALFEDGNYVLSGLVDMNKSKLKTEDRSFEMAKKLWAIIKKYKPMHLVIENVQQQSNPSTMIILARLAGMIIGYAEAHNVNVHILSPTQWRKALGYSQGPKVKRQELKQQSIDYVKTHYGLDVSEDESEAICEGIAAHKIYDFIEEDIWGD